MGHIRTLLAIIVIISHTESFFGFNFLGGKIAVQAFYIISGFYMSLILNEKYIGANNSYKLFISNRLTRLYPIYWVTLFFIIISSIVLAIITKGNNFGLLKPYIDNYNLLSPISLCTFIFSNIFLVFQDVLLFFQVNLENGFLFFQPSFDKNSLNGFNFALIPQAWTVALEISFYLIAPFIVKRKASIIVVIFIFFISVKYYLKQYLGLNYTPWNFRFFPNELPLFLLGAFSYKMYRSKLKVLFVRKNNIAVLLIITVFIIIFDKLSFGFRNEIFFILFFISIPFIFELSKKSKTDRYIGELSYPLYITHMFIINVVNKSNFIFITKGITVIMLSIVISILLKHLISDKIEIYRQGRLTKISSSSN